MRQISLVLSLAVFLVVPLGSARGDEESDQLQNLVSKNAPAVVNVKLVLKTETKAGGQGQDQESRTELEGAVVSPDGLVMISNLQFAPERMMELMGMGSMDSSGFGIKVRPTDIKVIIEREEKEYDAFLAATDTNLGLAFLKMEGLGDRKLTPVDFSGAPSPTVGQKIALVTRLSKGYDYAPYFQTARISGEVSKPRKAWLLEGSMADLGLPVYTLSGDVLGVLTTVASGVKMDSPDLSMGMGMLMRMFGGGGGGGMRLFVVPNAAINVAIGQAKQRAVEVAAERAKAKAAAPSTPAKPAPQKPAGPGSSGGKPAKP